MKIEDFDKNFVSSAIQEDKYTFYDAETSPFIIEGLPWYKDHHKFYRLPETMTEKEINKGALELANHTPGVRARFRTDSKSVVLRASLFASFDMNHMPRTGSAGFDLYFRENGVWRHAGSVQPGRDVKFLEGTSFATLPDKTVMRDWLINFPLYGGLSHLEIGLEKGALPEAPTPHKYQKGILFYGSSITQGGCASRPGNSYTAMLCRTLDAQEINLGFSGSGRGEIAVAEAIAALDLDCFVMDYDHNAPDVEHLRKTHEPFFRLIREKRPDLPIVMISRCDDFPYKNHQESLDRKAVIRKTYDHAVASGDKKVYFIDGGTLFSGELATDCTVDGCHPNDFGFFRMYEHILPVLRQVLEE